MTTIGVMLQGFEWCLVKDAQHWNKLAGQLVRLSSIAVDRLWIHPAAKAGATNSTGYDIYDLWDLGEFDQKGSVATSYDTKDELVSLSENAIKFGVTLLANGVLNQRFGTESTTTRRAYKVDPENRLQGISENKDIKAWIGLEFVGRNGTYSNKTSGRGDFSAVDYDELIQETALWELEGENNASVLGVSSKNGNYDYLIMADVAYANFSVQHVKAWGAWVTEELHLGGFRLDAAKHISRSFLNDWIRQIRPAVHRRTFGKRCFSR